MRHLKKPVHEHFSTVGLICSILGALTLGSYLLLRDHNHIRFGTDAVVIIGFIITSIGAVSLVVSASLRDHNNSPPPLL